jgi:hypothetical protein
MYIFRYIFIFLLVSSSLPGKDFQENFSDTKVKCGTFPQIKINKNNQPEILYPIDSLIGRPNLQKSIISPSSFFLIHFDTSGYNAVSKEDKNSNGIPDYIDSTAYYFDFALRMETDSMGYLKPLPDNNLGGSDKYDVYLMNIGQDSNAYYGLTRKDFEIKPRINFPRYATNIIIDNNFSPLDSTIGSSDSLIRTYSVFGIDALKITCVHEFHHAIQFSYGEQDFPISPLLNEMSSTWMEYRLFPEIKDYLNYVKILFQSPDKSPFGKGIRDYGYRWSIFGQYIYKLYGDSLLLRTWELIGDGHKNYEALDMAFKEKGSSLAEAWCGFLPWLYYTGSRAIDGEYFADARLFPELAYFSEEKFINPALIINGKTLSFEVRAYSAIIPTQSGNSLDTLSIMISNTDLQSAVMSYNSDKEFTLTITDLPEQNYNQIEGTHFFYAVNDPKGDICYNPFFVISNTINYVYPDPFNPDKNNALNIPVPQDAVLNETAYVKIYSIDMNVVYSSQKPIVINKTFRNNSVKSDRIVQINSDEIKNLTSGVYIFGIEYNTENLLGKFVIKQTE